MDLTAITIDQFQVFILILTRVSIILFLFPFFGSPMFPNMAKAGLALILSILLYPVVPVRADLFPQGAVAVTILIGAEFFIGLALALTVRLFFGGIQFAAQLVGFQMGFTMANVVDPLSGAQVSILEQLGYWSSLICFLIFNGHHFLILALVNSFSVIQMGWINLPQNLFDQIIGMSSALFILAIKIGAAPIAALLFTSTAFGISAKFAPQIHILIVAMPLKIIVGLFFFGFTLHTMASFTQIFVEKFPSILKGCLILMGGG